MSTACIRMILYYSMGAILACHSALPNDWAGCEVHINDVVIALLHLTMPDLKFAYRQKRDSRLFEDIININMCVNTFLLKILSWAWAKLKCWKTIHFEQILIG